MSALDLKAYNVEDDNNCFLHAIGYLLKYAGTTKEKIPPNEVRNIIITEVNQNINNVQTTIIEFALAFQQTQNANNENDNHLGHFTSFRELYQKMREYKNRNHRPMSHIKIVQEYTKIIGTTNCYMANLEIAILNTWMLRNYEIYIFSFRVDQLFGSMQINPNEGFMTQLRHIVHHKDYEKANNIISVVIDDTHYNYIIFVPRYRINNNFTTLHVPIISRQVLQYLFENIKDPIKLIFVGHNAPSVYQVNNTSIKETIRKQPVQKKNNASKKSNALLAQQIHQEEQKEQKEQKEQNARLARQVQNNAKLAEKMPQEEQNAQLAQQMQQMEQKEQNAQNSRLTRQVQNNAKLAQQMQQMQQKEQEEQNAQLARELQNKIQIQNSNAIYARQIQQKENAKMARELQNENQIRNNALLAQQIQQKEQEEQNARLARRLSNAYARGQNSPKELK